MKDGFVHIYCGDGKGKTTAAIGLALRCSGNGFKVLYCSFLKNTCSGEHKAVTPIDILKCDFIDKFCFQMNEEENGAAAQNTKKYFAEATKKSKQENYDMLVLDEVLDAIDVGYLTEDELAEVIDEKPKNQEIVITGRRAGEKIQARAQYISEIKCIKHPYEQGINARCGIEF